MLMKDFICEEDYPVVETDKGKIRGFYYNGEFTFRGVPYGQAKRFHAPVPCDPWEGIKNCTNYGPVTPTLRPARPSIEVMEPHRYWPQDENCQNLNIWTTTLDENAKKPVFFWIHGGGFSNGNAIELEVYDGFNLAKAADCVVVTVNHRLNLFGYFDLSSLSDEYDNSGNNGQLDLVRALQWVRDNIAKFGGDPDRVTIAGQSGGGGKVTALLQMPAADGLFQRAIVISGQVALHDGETTFVPKEGAAALMKELGFTDPHDLETVDRATLIAAYNKVRMDPALRDKIAEMPLRNEHFRGCPLRTGFRPEMIHVPVIIGTNYGEFTCYNSRGLKKSEMTFEEGEQEIIDLVGEENAKELLDAFKAAYPDRNPVDVQFADWLFRVPSVEFAHIRAREGGKIYLYLFAVDFPIYGGLTAWHGAGLPYLFHNAELSPITQKDGKGYEIQDKMTASLAAFMRTGDPNCPEIGGEWKPVTDDVEQTLIIGDEIRLADNFDRELMVQIQKYKDELDNGEIRFDHNFYKKKAKK